MKMPDTKEVQVDVATCPACQQPITGTAIVRITVGVPKFTGDWNAEVDTDVSLQRLNVRHDCQGSALNEIFDGLAEQAP